MLKKMSGEAYVDMLDKLANEVIEEGLSNEEPVTDEDAENMAKWIAEIIKNKFGGEQ